MIHFVVATNSEARPLIDLFKLKKIKDLKQTFIYTNQNISLTISGIGKVNAAIGVTQTYYYYNQKNNNIWINIGLAGHKYLKVGDICTINKITDNETKKNFFPFINKFKMQNQECLSVGMQKKSYSSKVYDMESFGFYQSACKYSSKELLQIVKIISDNQFESIDFKNKEVVYNIILNHKKLINELCSFMLNLKKEFYPTSNEIIENEFNNLFTKIKFTFTEREQMKALLKLYFTKHCSLHDNMINFNENAAYNIKKLKEFLKV